MRSRKPSTMTKVGAFAFQALAAYPDLSLSDSLTHGKDILKDRLSVIHFYNGS